MKRNLRWCRWWHLRAAGWCSASALFSQLRELIGCRFDSQALVEFACWYCVCVASHQAHWLPPINMLRVFGCMIYQVLNPKIFLSYGQMNLCKYYQKCIQSTDCMQRWKVPENAISNRAARDSFEYILIDHFTQHDTSTMQICLIRNSSLSTRTLHWLPNIDRPT